MKHCQGYTYWGRGSACHQFIEAIVQLLSNDDNHRCISQELDALGACDSNALIWTVENKATNVVDGSQ